MPDTVKTQVLKALAARLEEIEELGTVRRWQDIPTDLSLYPSPVLFFWEDEEKEPFNRLTLGRLDLWLEVFFPLAAGDEADYTRFAETAETVAGRIADLLAAPLGPLRNAGLIQAEPGRVVKAKHNPDWGVLFMTYQLTYVHNCGDAFAVT
jgi:hypothetical protein